jgi:hypothetical protein
VQVDFHYEEGNTGRFKPVVRNIELRNVTSKRSDYALYLRGYADAPIENIRLEDCAFEQVAKPDVLEHVRGLSRRNVRINGTVVSGNTVHFGQGLPLVGQAIAVCGLLCGPKKAGDESRSPAPPSKVNSIGFNGSRGCSIVQKALRPDGSG